MAHKRDNAKGGAGGVQLGLIITPMLDMSFQILAFFIMTYHPSSLEKNIPGSLVPPEDFAKQSKDKNNITPNDPLSIPEEDLNPELDAAVTVKVRAVMKGDETKWLVLGSPRQILVRTAIETEQQLIADVDGKDTTVDAALKKLDRELKAMVGKGSTKANLKIAPDGDLRQEYVMAVYDTCKNAGFSKVHFVPPPVLNTKIK